MDFQPLIDSFKTNGFVVLKDVLTDEMLQECRNGFHEDLRIANDVDYDNLSETRNNLDDIQTHTSGGLAFYYSNWRIKHCVLNEIIFEFSKELWKQTYANNEPGYFCPWSPFPTDRGYSYIDSLNFRIPSNLAGKGKDRLQKPIMHHIDINPWDPYGGRKGKTRWRPFQGFVALTDSTGGFECCPGFHTQMENFFSKIDPPKSEIGGFIALQGKKYKSIIDRFQSIQYSAKDAVLWDWRTPHKQADIHPGPDTREVIYTSFLPDIEINQNYSKNQKDCILKEELPPGKIVFSTSDTEKLRKMKKLNFLNF